MDVEDGQVFVKKLAHFVRTHEKALANALQLRRQPAKNGHAGGCPEEASSSPSSSTSSALAAAFSLGSLSFSTHNLKPVKLTLTPHHLYYLLDRFEEMGVPIGPMRVRFENIHTEVSPANYVSFLSESQRSRGRSDRSSIHSVSSVRSVMSTMSSLWNGFGLNSTDVVKTEKAKVQMQTDLKYLYSAFTKIPCLRLSPDRRARFIDGYEEFPFDTAVPLIAFKNLSALEICDVDFRQFYGWDRLADQLRSLTVKRSDLDDPNDLLVNIVLDDMDRRRRRSSKVQSSPGLPWPSSPSLRYTDAGRTNSTPPSPVIDGRFGQSVSPRKVGSSQAGSDATGAVQQPRTQSTSPSRPSSSRQDGSYRHLRNSPAKVKRSGSGSSNSSTQSSGPLRRGSSSNLLTVGYLPPSKWRFLRHLSLADNSLTSMAASSLTPLSNTLHSLDLSSNLFAEVPDCLANLTGLRALNLSNCMINSLHSLARSPLPAITALNLRENRLISIAGVERMLSLERLDLRDNRIQDPTELARLTSIPEIREIWILRNPFVKTHSNYRVTIFNLFRGTPGYSNDIVIDNSAPGYSERKQLKDRATELESVSLVRTTPAESIASDASCGSKILHAGEDTHTHPLVQPLPPQAIRSESTTGASQRRKGSRRRIVDLAQDGSPLVVDQAHIVDDVPQEPEYSSVGKGVRSESTPGNPTVMIQPLQTNITKSSRESARLRELPIATSEALSDKGRSLATEINSLSLNGEAYRQKIEALKGEVGSNWLSVLSEEGWGQHQNAVAPPSQFDHIGSTRPKPRALRAASQGIASGARKLG
ncbi:hypothetical protein ACLMJK_006687 [Lecanora helva]